MQVKSELSKKFNFAMKNPLNRDKVLYRFANDFCEEIEKSGLSESSVFKALDDTIDNYDSFSGSMVDKSLAYAIFYWENGEELSKIIYKRFPGLNPNRILEYTEERDWNYR